MYLINSRTYNSERGMKVRPSAFRQEIPGSNLIAAKNSRAVSRALMVLDYSHWVVLGSGTGVRK